MNAQAILALVQVVIYASVVGLVAARFWMENRAMPRWLRVASASNTVWVSILLAGIFTTGFDMMLRAR